MDRPTADVPSSLPSAPAPVASSPVSREHTSTRIDPPVQEPSQQIPEPPRPSRDHSPPTPIPTSLPHTRPASPSPGTPLIYSDRVQSPVADTIRIREPRQDISRRASANVGHRASYIGTLTSEPAIDEDRRLPALPQAVEYSAEPRPPQSRGYSVRRQGTTGSIVDNGRFPAPVRSMTNTLDHLVPTYIQEEKLSGPRSVEARLKPTLDTAKEQKELARKRASSKGRTLNIAIGLQVMLGALTTGLAAVATDRKMSTAVSVMGGVSTVISTYMAKARGENEPETSEALCKNLEQFIREAEAFSMDHGHLSEPDVKLDEKIGWFRQRLEDLITGDERHDAPV